MTGTIRAKLDGYFFGGTVANNAKAAFKFVWEHLKELETLGVVTEVARNNGTSAGVGDTGWWNDDNSFGNDCWTVFRWNTSSNRSWEWYFYMQAAVSYTAGVGAPALIQGGTSFNGLVMAAAISANTASGVTSNPWGGTTGSLGSDSKGDPVWVTGSVGDGLFVFPRSNNLSGSHNTSKQNLWLASSEGVNMRAHVITDEDSFLGIFGNSDAVSDYSSYYMSFIGTYKPNQIISSSVTTPLTVVQARGDAFGMFNPNIEHGGTAGNTVNCGGGIIAADKISVRSLRVDFPRPNINNAFSPADQWPSEIQGHISGSDNAKWVPLDPFLFVHNNESDYQGYVGQLGNQLIKLVRYAHSTHRSPDGTKIIFSTNRNWFVNSIGTVEDSVVLVPWTGSVDVGKNLGIRDGVFSGSIG